MIELLTCSKIGSFVRNTDVSAIVRGPCGLAFSADGNLHIAGNYSNNYTVFSPAGKVVRSLEFGNSSDVAIDAAGFAFAVSHVNNSN